MGEPIDEIPESARCLSCGYALRGLTMPRCPECGRPFNPRNRRTMNLGRRMDAAIRWWLRPPGRPLAFAVVLPNLLLLVAASAPGWYVALALHAGLVWLGVAAAWLFRFVVALCLAWHYRQPTFRRLKTWLRWSFAPAVAALTFALLTFRAPLYAAFWISRPAMDRLAQRVTADPNHAPYSTRVGVFYVTEIETIPGGVRFTVRGTGFDIGFMESSHGFAWSPGGEPNEPWESYHHIAGAWYGCGLDF